MKRVFKTLLIELVIILMCAMSTCSWAAVPQISLEGNVYIEERKN